MSRIYGATIKDSQPILVEIETTASSGVPNFFLHGLPSSEKLATTRKLQLVLKNHGVRIPRRKILTQVTPANVPNTDHSLDFCLAVSLLALKNAVVPTNKTLYVGALALQGSITTCPGIFALILESQQQGITRFCVPSSIAEKVALLTQQETYGFENLHEYLAHCKKQKNPEKIQNLPPFRAPIPHYFLQIAGQHSAKRAVTIAVAGKHPLLLVGPPGNGKTLLAQAAAELQPSPTHLEFLHIQKMRGRTLGNATFAYQRPWSAPHHTTPFSEFFGSQRSHSPCTLEQAHTGILFLDELPEFSKKILTALRSPLENKTLFRTVKNQKQLYPFDCTVIAAANPCPCGFYQVPLKECQCSTQALTHHKAKLTGPLFDRFHLFARVPHLDVDTLFSKKNIIRERMAEFAALRSAIKKVRAHPATQTNIIQFSLTDSARSLMQKAHQKLQLSARSNKNCQKVAQTIALLENEDRISADHIAEALQYRIQ